MSDGCARPVRSFFRSLWKVSTHLPMRVAASFLMSSIMVRTLSVESANPDASLVGDDRADILAPHHTRQVAGIVEIEHRERHAVVSAHDDGGGVHDVQPVGQHLVV